MQNRTCLVTGANRGLGLETARILAQKGATVLMAARDQPRGQQAVEDVKRSTGNQKVELLLLDLASRASIEKAIRQLRERPQLDVLINNAGVMFSDRRQTEDGFEATLAINHLGHFLLTTWLLDTLRASAERSGEPARIINVSSLIHHLCRRGLDFADLQWERKRYNGWFAYAQSKLANILFTMALAERLDPQQITANAVHPGIARSGFGLDGDTKGVTGFLIRTAAKIENPVQRPPAEGAGAIAYLAYAPELASITGEYYANRRLGRRSRASRDIDQAAHLWNVSEALTQKAG
jgi:NAD(P)-dependent dehydrogenase (short-subunit alcohol dehydrogenase family)